jgi:hypothetical protein
VTFEEIFQRYDIHPKFWAGLQALVLAGAKPTAELQIRLTYVENYQHCLRDLMSAGTRSGAIPTPANVPFQSIEVENEQSDRFSGPPNCGG